MIHAVNFTEACTADDIGGNCRYGQNCGKSSGRKAALKNYYTSCNEALSDERIDAFIVVSPTKYHMETVKAIAASGKHIPVKSQWL